MKGIDETPKLNAPDANRFGISKRALGPPFVVLDKSFLDAVSSVQLQYYALQGITFGVTDALIFELMRKRNDDRRKRSLYKLRDAQGLIVLPGVGEMFRAECETREPAPSVIRARRLKINAGTDSRDPFGLNSEELKALEQRNAALNERTHQMIEIWRDFRLIKTLKAASQKEVPAKLNDLEREIRDDRESMRKFYANHTKPPFPSANLIDERWACFRWIQVYLFAGVDFFRRHGLNSELNDEKLMHELLDLDYTITALLVGGLASFDKTVRRRFRFLQHNGFILC